MLDRTPPTSAIVTGAASAGDDAGGQIHSRAVRPKVICLLVRGSRTLWIRARDEVRAEDFLVPPGGGVEFGERLVEAIQRELLEELGQELAEPTFLGFSENRFEFNGRPEHELVFVYAARAPREDELPNSEFEVIESNGERLPAAWYSPEDLAHGHCRVYPDGILEYLPQALRLFGQPAAGPSAE